MKKLFLVSALLASLSQQAQTDAPQKEAGKKHELGLNLFAMDPVTDALDFKFEAYVVPAIYYKYHFGSNALRFSFNFQKNHLNRINSINPGDQYKSINAELLTIGYQRSMCLKSFQVFAFADLTCGLKQATYNPEPGVDYFTVFTNNTVHSLTYGGAMGGGIRYSLCKHLALSYEFSMGYKVESYSNNNYRYWYGFFNPVKQLGVAFIF